MKRERTTSQGKPVAWAVGAIAAVFSAVCLYILYGQGNTLFYKENHFMENVQAGLVFAGMATYLIDGARRPQPPARTWVRLAMAWLCLAIALREIDVEDLAVPGIVIALGSGNGRILLMAAFSAPLVLTAPRRWTGLLHETKALATSSAGRMLLACFVLLVAGALFDKGVLDIAPRDFYEELLECIAYLCLLGAAVLSFPRSPQPAL